MTAIVVVVVTSLSVAPPPAPADPGAGDVAGPVTPPPLVAVEEDDPPPLQPWTRTPPETPSGSTARGLEASAFGGGHNYPGGGMSLSAGSGTQTLFDGFAFGARFAVEAKRYLVFGVGWTHYMGGTSIQTRAGEYDLAVHSDAGLFELGFRTATSPFRFRVSMLLGGAAVGADHRFTVGGATQTESFWSGTFVGGLEAVLELLASNQISIAVIGRGVFAPSILDATPDRAAGGLSLLGAVTWRG